MSNEPEKSVTLSIDELAHDDKVAIVFDFYQGTPLSEIKENYNVAAQTVTALVKTYGLSVTRSTAFKQLEFQKHRETERAFKVKNKIYTLMEGMFDSMSEQPEAHAGDLGHVVKAFKELDNTIRLNTDQATQNIKTENTNKTVDINKVLDGLGSQEERLRFIQQQGEYDRDQRNNS